MNRVKKYWKYLTDILTSNFYKSVKFNFKMFPFKTACKLPVLFYGSVTLRSLEGMVQIKGRIFPGMIKFGVHEWYLATAKPVVTMTNNGTIIFNGPIRFLQGCYITVARKAVLEFGSKGALCGTDLKIMCFEHIKLGDNVRIPWGIQIYDTGFHYLEFEDGNKPISSLTKPIIIGDNVWIGNSSSITKGAIIPNDTIVASNSLVNHDFSTIKPYSLLAGVPAKVKAEGLKRVWDNKRQVELDKKFGYDRTHL